jgi:hypothetical protein
MEIAYQGGKEENPEMTEDDVWPAEEVTSLPEKDRNSKATKADPLLQPEPNFSPKGGNMKTAMK